MKPSGNNENLSTKNVFYQYRATFGKKKKKDLLPMCVFTVTGLPGSRRGLKAIENCHLLGHFLPFW